MHSVPAQVPAAIGAVRWPALVALALGLALVFGAGFASPAALHNATHDTRHAFGLPCH
jgi:cobalt transporter subunit CbtB